MPVVQTDGRSLGRSLGVRSRDYQFSGMGRLPHFLSYGAPRAGGAPLLLLLLLLL